MSDTKTEAALAAYMFELLLDALPYTEEGEELSASGKRELSKIVRETLIKEGFNE